MSETTTCGECGGEGYYGNQMETMCLGCAGTGLKTDKPREPSEVESIRAEVARLSALVPRWVPVGERLPPLGDDVRIAGGYGHYDGHLWRSALSDRIIEWKVTHWLEVPIPPLPGTEP